MEIGRYQPYDIGIVEIWFGQELIEKGDKIEEFHPVFKLVTARTFNMSIQVDHLLYIREYW
ncbi:hypothetical protein ES703_112803 [subsurface metagenome]